MPDLFHFSLEMQQFFNTLPPMVQESIAQSGAQINSLSDLQAVAAKLCGNEAPQQD